MARRELGPREAATRRIYRLVLDYGAACIGLGEAQVQLGKLATNRSLNGHRGHEVRTRRRLLREVLDLEDQLTVAETALRHIKQYYGHVCPEYEICGHIACRDSSAAWLTVDEALGIIERIRNGETADGEPDEEPPIPGGDPADPMLPSFPLRRG